MPFVRVQNTGAIGLNQDLSSHELPPNAWTDCRNITFQGGMASQALGWGAVYGTPSVTPYHVRAINVGSQRHWLYCGASKVYDVNSSTGSAVHTNLTKQSAGVDVDYSASPNTWTSTSLSGIPILNPGNTSIYPQQWDLNVSHRMTDLSNWPANTYCKSMRAFRNFLVALNVTKSGQNYPFMVKWSHPADPGAVPSTWDPTDPTKDAGELDVAEGGDPVVDGLQLGQSFMIYKQSSAWRMDFVGGNYVFQFTKVGGVSGCMNLNCIASVEINGVASHVVLTPYDVIVHDGQTATSILDDQLRLSLFSKIDAANTDKCFVFKNPFRSEVFICFPEGGLSVNTLALVWNYRSRTCSFRDIPNLYHADFGPLESGVAQPWDADAAPWDSDPAVWQASESNPDTARVLMASANPAVFLLDSSQTQNGTLPTAYLERRGLSLGAPETRKLVRGVRPRIKGYTGQTVVVKIGAADDPYSDPTYLTSTTFTIGSSLTCDCLVDGRYIAIRFEGYSDNYGWRLDSFDLDVQQAGMW